MFSILELTLFWFYDAKRTATLIKRGLPYAMVSNAFPTAVGRHPGCRNNIVNSIWRANAKVDD